MKSVRLPFVTLGLLAINIIAAFGLVAQPELLNQLGFKSNNPEFLSAFTSLFVHANIFHLLGNMIFLAAVGASVEVSTGPIRYTLVYLIGGFAGVGLHFLMTRNAATPVPLVGASGCIAACAGYYSSHFMFTRVPVWPGKSVPVLWVALTWLVLQASGAFITFQTQPTSTAFWAHLGGFCLGLVFSLLFSPNAKQRKVEDADVVHSPDKALELAEAELKKNPKEADALIAYAEAARTLHRDKEEISALQTLLEVGPLQEKGKAVRRLHQLKALSDDPIFQHKLATELEDCDHEAARMLLLRVLNAPNLGDRLPEVLYELAYVLMDESPAEAKTYLERLVKFDPLHSRVDQAKIRGWLP